MNTIQEILDYAKNPPSGTKKGTLRKCNKIAEASHLHNPEIHHLLPVSLSNLFQISLYTEEEFNLALKERIITPESTYRELEGWRTKRNNTRIKDHENYEVVPVVVLVKRGQSLMDKAIKEIRESLYFMDAEVLEVDKLPVNNNYIKFRWRKNRMNQLLSEGNYDPKEIDKLKLHIERIGGAGTQQQRYASRNFLRKWAKSGNVLASHILSEVYGEE